MALNGLSEQSTETTINSLEKTPPSPNNTVLWTIAVGLGVILISLTALLVVNLQKEPEEMVELQPGVTFPPTPSLTLMPENVRFKGIEVASSIPAIVEGDDFKINDGEVWLYDRDAPVLQVTSTNNSIYLAAFATQLKKLFITFDANRADPNMILGTGLYVLDYSQNFVLARELIPIETMEFFDQYSQFNYRPKQVTVLSLSPSQESLLVAVDGLQLFNTSTLEPHSLYTWDSLEKKEWTPGHQMVVGVPSSLLGWSLDGRYALLQNSIFSWEGGFSYLGVDSVRATYFNFGSSGGFGTFSNYLDFESNTTAITWYLASMEATFQRLNFETGERQNLITIGCDIESPSFNPISGVVTFKTLRCIPEDQLPNGYVLKPANSMVTIELN